MTEPRAPRPETLDVLLRFGAPTVGLGASRFLAERQWRDER